MKYETAFKWDLIAMGFAGKQENLARKGKDIYFFKVRKRVIYCPKVVVFTCMFYEIIREGIHSTFAT